MRERNQRAIALLVLVTVTALFASTWFQQNLDAWTAAQLRENAAPLPFAAVVQERYGPRGDDPDLLRAVASSE